WLNYCLDSIRKYCSGFRKVWVVSPQAPANAALAMHKGEWKGVDDESEVGYLAQQITKLYADVITDYQADFILHVDSDVLITQPITPQHFFRRSGNPIWYYPPYSVIDTPWKPITEKFMLRVVENEFMRRFPIMVPRWLY